jgi:hypothetical protein
VLSADKALNKKVGIIAGKGGRNGQGYRPAVKLPSGELVPYNAAETTMEQLGDLIMNFTALREKTSSGTKEYQTITNFLRVIRAEKSKRASAGGMATPRAARGKASGGGGAASARAGGGEEDEDEE